MNLSEAERLKASAWLDISRLASEARMDKALGVAEAYDPLRVAGLSDVRERRLRVALHKLNVASYA